MGSFRGTRRARHLYIAVNGHYDPVSPSFKNNGRGATVVGGDAPDSNLGLVAMNNSVELFLSAMILDGVPPSRRPSGPVAGARRVMRCRGGSHKLDFVERATRRGHCAIAWRRTWRERIRFHRSQPVGWIMEQLGSEMLCFASDYPHPEGSRDPIGKFEATMEDVSQADLDALFAAPAWRRSGRA